MAAMVSLGLALLIVPRQVTPWTGLILMYEWTFTIYFIVFGGYLNLINHWGNIMASRSPSSLSHDDDSGKGIFSKSRAYSGGYVFHLTVSSSSLFFSLIVIINFMAFVFTVHQRQISSCDAATWFYGLGIAFLAIVAPSLPCLFGITALFLR